MLAMFLFFLYIILFIGGMTIMRTGLMKISGDFVKNWMTKFTSTPLKGLLFGIVITIILQSSSAVMIITIGLISVGLITFPQSIGIILGTNIGTTATVEFLAYGTDQFIFPLLIAGLVFIVFARAKWRNIGLLLFGLGCIFLAMLGFEKLAIPLSQSSLLHPIFAEMNDHIYVAAIAGTITTAIIQSSTAMTGIAMGFIHTGIIHLPAAIAVMLGANIGTCADAYIASIGGGKEAKRAAYAHIWLNVTGVLLFLPFTVPFAHLMEQLSIVPEQQLAHASVIFNIAVSLIILPFAKPFAGFIYKVHK